MAYAPAPLVRESLKSGPWNAEGAFVDPVFQDLWQGLEYLVPVFPGENGQLFQPGARRRTATINDTSVITPGFGPLGSRLEWGSVLDGDGLELADFPFGLNDDNAWSVMLVLNVGAYTTDQKAILSQAGGSANWSQGVRVRLTNTASPTVEWLDDATGRTGEPSLAITADGDAVISLTSQGLANGEVRIGVYDYATGDFEFGTVTGITESDFDFGQPVLIGANGANDEAQQIALYMAAVWSRHIPDGEWLRLYADPFGLIRPNWDYLTAAGATFPAAPTNLTATAVSTSQIDLSWDAVSGAGGYDIERDGVVIVSDQAGTTYSDTGLNTGQSYDYRVRAVS